MPLSEHEQRILEDIERRLQQDDPRFAQQVAHASLSSELGRRVRLGVLLFVAGFVMLMLFWVSVWVAITGFAVMLGAALFVYQHLRRASAEGRSPLPPGGSLPGFLGRFGRGSDDPDGD